MRWIVKPLPVRMCRCKKREAVVGQRCGHCYVAHLERIRKSPRQQNSNLQIGGNCREEHP